MGDSVGAHQLAQSPRSLQRRLQQEGLSSQQILDEVRLELALYYERTKADISKAELADRLSFSDFASPPPDFMAEESEKVTGSLTCRRSKHNY